VLRKALVIVLVGIVMAAATSAHPATDRPVEVISTAKVRSLDWLWTHYSTMTFSPDGAYFLLGEERPDGYIHLCAHETSTATPLKCVVRLYKSRGSSHGSLDWADDRLFIQAGGFDEAFVGWVDIQGWQKETFREIDGLKRMRFVQGKEGMQPAWDRKEGGLYYRGAGEFSGIYFEKGGIKTKRFEMGEIAIPGDKYIWYTEIGENAAALRRLDRGTKKPEVLSKGDSFGVDSLTASPHDHVLFVRSEYGNEPNSRVYTFTENRGVWGPVYGPADDGEIKFVRISPTGDRTLLSVHDAKHSTPGRNRHHIYLLRLRWSEPTTK
jgi:hypothetical protein